MVIRIRRITPTRVLRRRRYEIEVSGGAEPQSPKRETTTAPVTALGQHLGVGDAWALVHAADAAWNGETGEWVAFRPRTITLGSSGSNLTVAQVPQEVRPARRVTAWDGT